MLIVELAMSAAGSDSRTVLVSTSTSSTLVPLRRSRRLWLSVGRDGVIELRGEVGNEPVGHRRAEARHEVVAGAGKVAVVTAGDVVEVGSRQVVKHGLQHGIGVQSRRRARPGFWSAMAIKPAQQGADRLVPESTTCPWLEEKLAFCEL